MPVLEIIYLFSTALLALYGLHAAYQTWHFRRSRPIEGQEPAPLPTAGTAGSLPLITVQLPIYNERHVVHRLLEAVLALEWPPERLQVQILDDSTDDTALLVQAALARLGPTGVDLVHLRRTQRQDFKAGALREGLAAARGELVAIFDADFVPPRDFLVRVVPCFDDPRVGCVQARWGHLNPQMSLLTQAQQLGIDGHFEVEQQVRHELGAFLNFNGTAGIWRRRCIEEVGGWQGDTLTEDLDLSYRAQLAGWRIAYRSDVVVPAELPVQMDALKRQQFRWAKGSIQTALKLGARLWCSQEPLWRKILGTLHLTNYAVHPLMLLNLLLLLPMLFSQNPLLTLTPLFTVAAVGPPWMYWTAMGRHQLAWPIRVGRLLHLMMLGTGLSLNNSRACLEALLGRGGEFKRTPKFAVTGGGAGGWQESSYVLPRSASAWIELLLAIYSSALLVTGLLLGAWWVLPWLFLYAGGYICVAQLAFLQAWQMKGARALALSAGPLER